MRSFSVASTLFALVLTLSTASCIAPDLAGVCDVGGATTPAEQLAMMQRCSALIQEGSIDYERSPQLDVLFVVANTPSMVAKQQQLAQSIESFMAKFDRSRLDYHIGVTSTDIGAQAAPATSFQPGNRNAPGCASFFGDDGELQDKLCTQRDQSAWSTDAKAACTAVCPYSQGLPGGVRFLYRRDGLSNAPNQDVAGTLRCMLMLGDGGCTIQSPLEAAKRALDNHSTTNSGFLRKNSHLLLIFVSDEDDCSVRLSARSQNDPATVDCTGNTMSVPPSACFNTHFRCLANSIRCSESLTSPGLKTGCVQSETGYLESVEKYVRFFSSLRSPDRLSIVGLWAPTMLDNPLGDLRLPGKLMVNHDDSICLAGAGATCPTSALDTGKGIAAACRGADPRMTGRAQLRLSSFARNFPEEQRLENSICNADYGSVLRMALDTFTWISRLPFPGCLEGKPMLDSRGKPLCLVGLVDASVYGAVPDRPLPVCGTGCCQAFADAGGPMAPGAKPFADDPTIIAACRVEPSCYCAVPLSQPNWSCTTYSTEPSVVGVWLDYESRAKLSDSVVRYVCSINAR